MKRILVISDTHGENSWVTLKSNYDFIIHAGDHLNNHHFMINNSDYFVDGNNDFGNSFFESFKIDEFNFILVHGDEQGIRNYNSPKWFDCFTKDERFTDADVIIFGHTHLPIIKTIKKQILINPGSFSKPRLGNKKSYCEIIIDKENIQAKLIYL